MKPVNFLRNTTFNNYVFYYYLLLYYYYYIDYYCPLNAVY